MTKEKEDKIIAQAQDILERRLGVNPELKVNFQMEKLKQVDAVCEFNKEGYGWSETVITDESVLAVLEMRYNIQIALAIEYKEGSETKSIHIVTKDRKHYKIYLK